VPGGSKRTTDIPSCLRGDMRRLALAMRDYGWTFVERKHPQGFAPDGRTIVTLTCTPGSQRTFRDCRALFRRWCRQNQLEPNI
jgi:hypothetical protein